MFFQGAVFGGLGVLVLVSVAAILAHHYHFTEKMKKDATEFRAAVVEAIQKNAKQFGDLLVEVKKDVEMIKNWKAGLGGAQPPVKK